MSKARIIHEFHDDFGVTLSEAEKAYNIAVEYIRLRSAIEIILRITNHQSMY